MKRENITWRSWCDGGGSANTPGPIARQFHVNGWPTVYVIDDLGVVRLKLLGNPGSKNFNSAIDALVADAVSKGVSDTDQAKAPSGAPASAPAGGRKPRS
jgi:hypothetical protein